MVKKPNGVAKATAASAGPSKANPSTPGSAKTSKFKKRRVKANREKAAAASAAVDEAASVGAGTAGGDASASAVSPQPSHVAEASPVAQMPKPAIVAEASPVTQTPKPAIDAEGSGPAPTPATAEPSASVAKPKTKPADAEAEADADAGAVAAAAASKGKGVGADNRGGDGRTKSRRERARNGKGKEVDEDGGSKGKGKKAVGKKEERGDNKGAGFIFMCNAKTKQECYKNRLFGLPSGKVEMVKKIRPGAKLFLYDFDLKLLYGVYKAASHGGLNLVREAFDGKFPAQVKFKIDKDCLPLTESSIKQAIKENYKSRSKFDPELTARQVHRLLALFKPVNVPQSAPDNHREERRRYEERRQPHRFEERRPSLPIEEVRQARFDEERRPAARHVPHDDPYRAPRFAPLPVESELGHSLARGDHHRYYQPALAPEPRHIPLALEHHHVPSVPELRHVPAAYYQTLAPSSDSYYRSVENLAPERYADRTVADITARETIIPRDYARLPGEISARSDRLEDLYRNGGIAVRGAHVEELYPPGEIAARADRVGITTRADHLEDLYRSDRLLTRAVDPMPRSTYHTAAYETYPAYAETSTRPVSARISSSGVPVSSLYSFAGGPAYR
ncbi:unnamed protein product [Urochloa humidicola]